MSEDKGVESRKRKRKTSEKVTCTVVTWVRPSRVAYEQKSRHGGKERKQKVRNIKLDRIHVLSDTVRVIKHQPTSGEQEKYGEEEDV